MVSRYVHNKMAVIASTTIGVVITAGVVGALLMPCLAQSGVMGRAREAARKSSCQSNLKELGLAFNMYYCDYDYTLPSSMLYGHSKKWNKQNFILFAKLRGMMPPSETAKNSTMMQVLYRHMKNKDIMWCPSDPNVGDYPAAVISYYYKAAADRAWYGDCRKLGDFEYPADQIIFWEHNSWHWGQQADGVTNGATINVAYLDGHVCSKRIQNSGYTKQENPPDPLPKSMMGEPAWYNRNCFENNSTAKTGTYWDPKRCYDDLQ